MPGSISDFKASFNNGGIARPSRFDVSIPVPLTLIPYRGISSQLSLRCETTELPSRTFATAERKVGSNPSQKFPYIASYNDISMTFIVSEDMSEKTFFDTWMEYINPTYSFNFRYKQDYVSSILVNQYDATNTLTYSINLIDAFPVAVNQLDLDWSTEGHHKLTVVFAYSYWVNNSIQALGASLLSSAIASVVGGLGGLGSLDGNDGPDPYNPFSTINSLNPNAQNRGYSGVGGGGGINIGNESNFGVQKLDDGSSIQTFDDGSTLVTDSEGGLSSTPAIDGASQNTDIPSGDFDAVEEDTGNEAYYPE
jgi:hypothetical protein